MRIIINGNGYDNEMIKLLVLIAIEEQERVSERDAQINMLKQLLNMTPQKNEPSPSKSRQRRHKSFHEGDNQDSTYKQMLERLIDESKMNSHGTTSDLEAKRDGFVYFNLFLLTSIFCTR